MNPFLSISVQENLVLASASPRRERILKDLGFEFDVVPSRISEDGVIWKDPVKKARILAELKAVEVQKEHPRKTIIGADTIVAYRGEALEKPADPDDAARMLRLLSGKTHQVITGVAIAAPPNRRFLEVERTRVFFRELSAREIERYIDSAEPFDKAGAYAIQGYASVFVDKIEGCFFNVVGLPVPLLFRMLRDLEGVI